jgi:hypothetical protein
MKSKEFLDQERNYYLPKKGSAPWRYLIVADDK